MVSSFGNFTNNGFVESCSILTASRRSAIENFIPFYYGWVNLILAVIASVVALPSLTWGLGLITEPLLQDLGLSPATWAQYNFWATATAGIFLLPAGLLVDRLGSKIVAIVSSALLGLSIWQLSRASTGTELVVSMTCARIMGQGVLAVASVAMVGKWFSRRVSLAMTLYGVLVILAYMAAERLTGESVRQSGWRQTWSVWGTGICAGSTCLLILLARSHPRPDDPRAQKERGLSSAHPGQAEVHGEPRNFTLWQAAMTPIFWVFCLAGAANGGSQAVVSLFGISILEANGIQDGLATFLRAIAVISSFGAIAGVLLSGLLCRFASQANVLRVACVLGFAASLLLPHATTATQADLFGAIWGLQCGVLMVVTNSVWAEYYGGKSQGAIEGFTMFVQFAAQAGGPWLLTSIAGNSVAPGVFRTFRTAVPEQLVFSRIRSGRSGNFPRKQRFGVNRFTNGF